MTQSPNAAATHPVPDCTAALEAWKHAYQKRNADGFFKRRLERRLEALMLRVRDLLAAAPTDGGPLTFQALDRIPQPAQDFYSELICASESLAELIADHDPMRTTHRHAALVLIGDALGALKDDDLKNMIRRCGCRECWTQMEERTMDPATRDDVE